MQRLGLAILFVFFSFQSQAQNRTIDSLFNSLNQQRADSNIYKAYIRIADAYADSSYDKSLFYFNKALNLAEKSSERKRVAHVYHKIGSLYLKKGEFPTALQNFTNALEIHEYLNNKRGIGQLLNDIGLIYRTWGKYDKALENYFKALKLFDEIGDEVNGAMASNSIGQIYYYRSEYETSIEYFKRYLGVNKKNKAPRAVAGAANNIASAFLELEKYDQALEYYVRSMRIYDSLGIKIGVAIIKDNIGSLFIKKKQYNDALLYNSAALSIFEEIGSKPRICASLQSVGLAYSKLDQFDLALKYLNRSLSLALSIKQKETQKDVYSALTDVYIKTKQYEQALSSYKRFVEIKDSLLNSESIEKIETIQAEYAAQKKEKELAEINQKLHFQKILTMSSIGLFILFIFLTALIIRENRFKRKIIKNAEGKTSNLYSIIGKTAQNLLSLQNGKDDLISYFKRFWQINSRENSESTISFLYNDSILFVALLSKDNPSVNVDIIKLSIFDFFHTLKNLDSSVSIKEQYHNFMKDNSVWQNHITEEMQINVDFWCIKKDCSQHQYHGALSAFHVDNQHQISDLRNNTTGWLKVTNGDRFYLYTSNCLSAFNQNERELFQNTLRKTIAKTIDLSFDEQKEIFSNSLELIEAGNDVRLDISIAAFMV
jgi:tetratricopeptide (TPR) repeat protein